MSVIIDDSDPMVVYSSGWRKGGAPDEYDHTTTAANQAGMTARLNFQGIGVTVYGTIGPWLGSGSPESSYVLDGSSPVIFSASQTDGIQYNQLFYQSPILSDGLHTLAVTNLYRSDRLYLDYFVVVLPDANPPTSPPPQVTTTPSSLTHTTSHRSTSSGSNNSSSIRDTTIGPNTGSVVGNVTATASFTVTVPPTAHTVYGTSSATETLVGGIPMNSASSSGESYRTAVIIASTLAAMLGVTLFLCVVYAWRRRRRRPAAEQIISSFHEPPRSFGREKAVPPNQVEGSQFTFHESPSTTYSLETTGQHSFSSTSSMATAGQQSVPLQPQRPSCVRDTSQRDDLDPLPPVYPPNDPPSYDQEVMQDPSSPRHSLPSKLRNEYNFDHREPGFRIGGKEMEGQ